ncbi:MAG TPA: SDR family oxidoreductase, partial [Pyrinomonadaceae bacterium]
QLPTYPFERRRYWVEWQEPSPADHARRGSLRRQTDVADWFYLPYWKPSAKPSSALACAAKESAQRAAWLVFADEVGLGERIAERLKENGSEVFIVRRGESFAKLDGRAYTIDIARQEDYEALALELKLQGQRPWSVVHALSVTAPETEDKDGRELSARTLDESFYSLTFLAQALGRHQAGEKVSITVLSNGMQRVTGEERLVPEKATAVGPCRVIPQEYPDIACRIVDVVFPAADARQEERLLGQLISELAADAAESLVAYRDNRRWVQAFEPVRLERPPADAAPLKEEGVYLITGGLGGIGLVLARHLAQTLRARLVLTARAGLPPREQWPDWLATHEAEDESSVRMREILALENLGAEVLALGADVADAERMREVLRLARERFGRIDGVVHAAGISPGGMIETKTAASAASILAAKVWGTRVLEELFKDEQLDFLVLFSSLASVAGAFGQVDYCAANAFLDAFAHYNLRRSATPTITVNWDTWREVGMAVKAGQSFSWHAATAQGGNGSGNGDGAGAGEAGSTPDYLAGGISSAEGVDAFARILSNDAAAQVLVSTRDLTAVIRQAGELNRARILEEVAQFQQTRTAHPRPQLQVAYVPPRNELEERIASVWQSVLGIEQVGIHDNFFDLGGHSLLATQLLSRLREFFHAEIPLRVVFEKPTVAGLAEHMEEAGREAAATAQPPAIVPVARQARTVKRTRK